MPLSNLEIYRDHQVLIVCLEDNNNLIHPPHTFMATEWNNYVQSLSDKFGKLTNVIWISKKRQKYILEFAYTRMLVINGETYKFNDILSCRIEKAASMQKLAENASEPYILLIGVNDNTNMLLSITVWSKSVATEINNLIQEIVKSNKILR